MKVCFVTTSFIRSAQDHYARFVYEQAKSLRAADAGISVVVVAPHAPGLATQEVIDGLDIRRAKYFCPSRLQRLAYQHEGLFETLRGSCLAILQLPLLLTALLFKLWRVSNGAQTSTPSGFRPRQSLSSSAGSGASPSSFPFAAPI